MSRVGQTGAPSAWTLLQRISETLIFVFCLGVIHEGTPKGPVAVTFELLNTPILTSLPSAGKWEKLGGVDCYVAAPTIDYPKDKAVLFMADIFGAQLVNAQVCSM